MSTIRRTRSTGSTGSTVGSRSRKRNIDESSDDDTTTTSTSTRTRKSIRTISPVREQEDGDDEYDPYDDNTTTTTTKITPSKRKEIVTTTEEEEGGVKRARGTPVKRTRSNGTNGTNGTAVSPPRRVTRGSSRTRDAPKASTTSTSTYSAALETIPDQESVLTRVPSLISRHPRRRATTAAATTAERESTTTTSTSTSTSTSSTSTSTSSSNPVTRTSSSPKIDRKQTQSYDYREQQRVTPTKTTTTTEAAGTSSVDLDQDQDGEDEEVATQRARFAEMERRVRESLKSVGQELPRKVSELFARLTDRSAPVSIHDANVMEQELMQLLRSNASLPAPLYDVSHPSPHYELEPEFTRGLAVEDIPIPSTVLEHENFAMVVDSGALNVATKMLEIDPQLVNQVGGLSRAPALSYAIKNHDLNMVRFLLNARANPTIRDDKGNTPLHYCAIHKNADAIPLLLECGALPDLKTANAYGLTPIGEGQKRQFYLNLNDYGIAQYGSCSYLRTNTNRAAQWFYECLTCDLVGDKGCCDVCMARCHQGHQTRLVDLPSRGFCDCGPLGPAKCKALDLPDTDLTKQPPIYIPGSHLAQLAAASTSTSTSTSTSRAPPSAVTIPPAWTPAPYEPPAAAAISPRDPQLDMLLKMMETLLQERTKLDAIKTKVEQEGQTKDKKKSRRSKASNKSLSVADLLKYAVILALAGMFLFILFDTYQASISVGKEELRAEGVVKQQTARDQYRHDCIDANIAGLRRVAVYNTKRNETGHLVGDADCERYKRYMEMDPLKLAQGEGKLVARKLAETMDSFISNLSAKTIAAYYLSQQGLDGVMKKVSVALDFVPGGNYIKGLYQLGSAAATATTTKH